MLQNETMRYTEDQKNQFAEKFRKKTKQLAVDVIKHCRTFPREAACNVVVYQLIKSATSVGANYRAACRARSDKEFFSKLSITVEEADETEYWLSVVMDMELDIDQKETDRLRLESLEILKVIAKARSNVRVKR